MKWPFMKFYPRDWQADPELRMCSMEARGLWLECLCVMHSAKRRGYMETPQGLALTDDQTARLIGIFKGDLIRCKDELILHGVPSFEDETGIMYCRRMVKETAKAEKCSAAGRKGGGNPSYKTDSIKRIPEARSHISLKDTFKGQISDDHASMVEEVINCRPEFRNVNPEALLLEIHKAGENPLLKQNHEEFIAHMANEISPPNNPPRKYGAYLQSSGRQSMMGQTTAKATI